MKYDIKYENNTNNGYEMVIKYIEKFFRPLTSQPKIFTIDDISKKFGISLLKATEYDIRLERIENKFNLDTQLVYYKSKIVGVLVLYKNYRKNSDNFSIPRYKLFNLFTYLSLEENLNDICNQVINNIPLNTYYHYKLDYARFLYILFISDIPNDRRLLSVDYIDNNPLNNDLKNLQLLSNYYNYVRKTIKRYKLNYNQLYKLAKHINSITGEDVDYICEKLEKDYNSGVEQNDNNTKTK